MIKYILILLSIYVIYKLIKYDNKKQAKSKVKAIKNIETKNITRNNINKKSQIKVKSSKGNNDTLSFTKKYLTKEKPKQSKSLKCIFELHRSLVIPKNECITKEHIKLFIFYGRKYGYSHENQILQLAKKLFPDNYYYNCCNLTYWRWIAMLNALPRNHYYEQKIYNYKQ